MTISPKISKEIYNAIQNSDNILLTLHPSPDGDSFGSNLGLYHFLKSINKKVTLIKGDSDLTDTYSFLPGFKDISPLSIQQLDLDNYDLFIVLDINVFNRITAISNINIPPALQVINVDHHPDNDLKADIKLLLVDYTSTSEIISTLLRINKQLIPKDSASCFAVGIFSDTGGFKNLNTTPHSISELGILAKFNPILVNHIRMLSFSHKPEDMKFIKLALSCLNTYNNGKVAISAISYQQLIDNKITEDSISKAEISDFIKTVLDWKISISMVEEKPGITTLSLRSMDKKYDVSVLASQVGKGGGHQVASGALINMPLNDALQHTINQIKKTYPEL